jgi:hypothetical protein
VSEFTRKLGAIMQGTGQGIVQKALFDYQTNLLQLEREYQAEREERDRQFRAQQTHSTEMGADGQMYRIPSVGEAEPLGFQGFLTPPNPVKYFDPDKGVEVWGDPANAVGQIAEGPETRTVGNQVVSIGAGREPEVLYTAPETYGDKTAVGFMLPNGNSVLSYDGGRTYKDPLSGDTRSMPSNAVRMGTESGVEQARAAEAVTRAREELGAAPPGGASPTGTTATQDAPRRTLEGAARGGEDWGLFHGAAGTGPGGRLRAATDAVIGGLGLDRAFGADGVFPETQDNRQFLRTVRQLSKNALLQSARGAIWEQQRVEELFPNPDTFWTNPTTEANKVRVMRDILSEERSLNTQLIASGTLSPDRIEELTSGNLQIDRALSLIGEGGNAQPQISPSVGPQPGTIEDGYRFLGGNPADPNNWQPVQ